MKIKSVLRVPFPPLLTLAVILYTLTTTPAHGDEPRQRLNVMLITADDMNADSCGWLGNELGVTPNLDMFAKSAHRFVNAHVTIPICQPVRAVMMTGRLPHRNGALGFHPVDRNVSTLPEVLRDAGYYVATIAKAAHMKPNEKFPWDAVGEQSLGKQPVEFARKFQEMLAEANQQDKPFFINANICDPHRPFIKFNQPSSDSDLTLKGVKRLTPDQIIVPAFLEDLPEVRREVAQYYANVSRFDVSFGLLMEALETSGHHRDTVVLFFSDHGMSFPFSKATVYYNGTWSPVLLRIPNQEESQTRQEFVSTADIMPTLLELLEVPLPAGMDGRSWLPLLAGESQPNRDFVVTHVNTVFGGRSYAQRCFRTADRSLMFHAWVDGSEKFRVEAMSGLSFNGMKNSPDPKVQARVKQYIQGERLMLFDLQSDPDERNNLIAEASYQDDLTELSQKLLAYLQSTDDPQSEAFAAELATLNQQEE